MADDIVKADILEAYLFDRLLEFGVVENLKSVSVDKQHCVSFYLCVA